MAEALRVYGRSKCPAPEQQKTRRRQAKHSKTPANTPSSSRRGPIKPARTKRVKASVLHHASRIFRAERPTARSQPLAGLLGWSRLAQLRTCLEFTPFCCDSSQSAVHCWRAGEDKMAAVFLHYEQGSAPFTCKIKTELGLAEALEKFRTKYRKKHGREPPPLEAPGRASCDILR